VDRARTARVRESLNSAQRRGILEESKTRKRSEMVQKDPALSPKMGKRFPLLSEPGPRWAEGAVYESVETRHIKQEESS